VQRTTLYERQTQDRVDSSFAAPELLPVVNRPFVRKRSRMDMLEPAE
jgi:hypothetical protein